MSLRGAPDGWVAGHVRRAVRRQGTQPHPTSEPGGRMRGFHSGVTGTKDNDVEVDHVLFSDTEVLEDVPQHIFRRPPTNDLVEMGTSRLKIGQDEFLRCIQLRT